MIQMRPVGDPIAAPRRAGQTMKVHIQDIVVKDRFRKDKGDIDVLMKSIKELGLLQPIGITQDNILVFGERRLTACFALGWSEIDARIVDVSSIVEGEFAENDVRKSFTPSERLAIAEAVEREIGRRHGGDRKTIDFQAARMGGLKGDTRTIVARKAGFSSHGQMERTAKVVENGSAALLAAVDTGKVSISKGAEISNLTKPEQVVSLHGEKAAREDREEAEKALLEEVAQHKLYHPANAYTDFIEKFRKRPSREEAAGIGRLLGSQVKADDGTMQPPKSSAQKASEKEARSVRKEEEAVRLQCRSVTAAVGYLAHCKDDPSEVIKLIDRWETPAIAENIEHAVDWINRFAKEWRKHAEKINAD